MAVCVTTAIVHVKYYCGYFTGCISELNISYWHTICMKRYSLNNGQSAYVFMEKVSEVYTGKILDVPM